MLTDKTYNHWKLSVDKDHILWLTIDRQGAAVNSLSREIFDELDDIIDGISKDKSLTAVIIKTGKPSGFIAGADIEQFTRIKNREEAFDLIRQAQIILDKLDVLPIPVIAMVEGFCLGGGLELALACDYIVAASDDPKTIFGAPEVKLGIHPGWGGTVRLPERIGVINAMRMNLTGKSFNAKESQRMGLVDAAVPKRQLEHAAHYYALNKPPKHQPVWWQKMLNYPGLRSLVGKKLYQDLEKKVNKAHYPAPYAIVENWIKDGSTNEAMLKEAESIATLLLTETSRNLVRVFFLQTRLKSFGKETKFKPLHVHVIGAGVMGGAIAALCAARGIQVTLQDCEPKFIAGAIKRAYKWYSKTMKQPRLVQAAMDRLRPDIDGFGIKHADVVIEAISENLKAKQDLYQLIEPVLKEGAILATNTSSLPLDQLNKVLKNPERLVSIHYFNPVEKMKLVEVARGEVTSDEIFNKALAFVRGLDRLPLPVHSSPGFLVNRILMPYLLEAMILLEEGVPAAVIDKAAVDFGMPMGPIELADTVGLDICLSVADILSSYFGDQVPERLREKVAHHEYGRKTGKGFYIYQNGKPLKDTVAQTDNLDEIADRLIFRMLNESVKCLQEGIVADADLVDAGMIFGTGFAPFRGGPLHYARSLGVGQVVVRMRQLQDKYGSRFKPADGWKLLQSKVEPVATE